MLIFLLIFSFEKLDAEKTSDDGARFSAFQPHSMAALSKLNPQGSIETFRQSILLPGESEIMSIRIVAVKGIVTNPSDMAVGRGVIVCTKLPKADGSSVHRLHFFINEQDSEFEALQSSDEQKMTSEKGKTCFETGSSAKSDSAKARQLVRTTQNLHGTFRTCNVEGNLVHIHSEVEQVGKYTSEMSAEMEGFVSKESKLRCSYCLYLCCICCTCDCCPKCPKCCPKCPACPHCCICSCCDCTCFKCCSENVINMSASRNFWEHKTMSERDLDAKLDALLVLPWETSTQGVYVQLPGMVSGFLLKSTSFFKCCILLMSRQVHYQMELSCRPAQLARRTRCISRCAIPRRIRFTSVEQLFIFWNTNFSGIG